MATSTITNTITDPSGTAVSGARVVARLLPLPGFRVSDSSEIADQEETVKNGSGVWTLALERTSNITPANTFYEVTEYVPSGGRITRRVWNISVPDVSASLLASLITPPTANPAYDTSFAAQAGMYGRVFPVSAYSTIHAAYDALVAAGGGILQVRGTIPVTTDFLIDDEVPCFIDGYGGTLAPSAGVVALSLEVGSSGVPLASVAGLRIDGTSGGGSAGGTIGIRIKSNVSGIVRDVQIDNCGIGLQITDDAAAWSESSSLDAVTIDGCLVGVDFDNGDGTGSFGYMAWGRVAIYNVPSGGVGFRVGAGCFLYHFDLSMLVIQTTAALTGGTTATLMEIDGAVGRNSRWHVVLESSGGAFSGTRNGLSLLSNAVTDGLGMRCYWQGTFTNKILNPSTIAYQLRESTDRGLTGNSSAQNLQEYSVFGESNPRTAVRAGRIMFGDGTSATLDAQIVRYGTNRLGADTGDSWQVDGTWNGGLLRLGDYRIWVDATGRLLIKNSAPANDTDGTVVGTQT